MTHYFVVSPEVSVVFPILDDGTGPTEHFSCVVSVEAKNKREAKSLALKDESMAYWIREARDNNQNPLSGLKIEDPVCKHGVCWCDICGGECEQCYDEVEQTEVIV